MPQPDPLFDSEEFDRRFEHHVLDGDKPRRCEEIRQAARKMSLLIIDACPPGRERAVALTNIEQAMMWANAGVARATGFHNIWDTEPQGRAPPISNPDQ